MKNESKFFEKIVQDIQDYILDYLKNNNISSEDFALMLGLFPLGGEVMMKRNWSVEETFWILEKLTDYIDFTIELKPRKEKK